MKTHVTETGLHIPPELLLGLDEVQIRKELNRVIIEPAPTSDPLRSLGTTPVEESATDASVNHDAYHCRQ